MGWTEVLYIGYTLAVLATLGKAIRYFADAMNTGNAFYFIGVPSNLALAGAMLLIGIASGENPIWNAHPMRVAIRTLFIAWAASALIFEFMYWYTILGVSKEPMAEAEEHQEEHEETTPDLITKEETP